LSIHPQCPAATAAPLPGNFSQNIFTANLLTSCRKFLSSYMQCWDAISFTYCLQKHFASRLLKFIILWGTIRSLKSQICRKFYIWLRQESFVFGFCCQEVNLYLKHWVNLKLYSENWVNVYFSQNFESLYVGG
jgi:hypothetical protein